MADAPSESAPAVAAAPGGVVSFLSELEREGFVNRIRYARDARTAAQSADESVAAAVRELLTRGGLQPPEGTELHWDVVREGLRVRWAAPAAAPEGEPTE